MKELKLREEMPCPRAHSQDQAALCYSGFQPWAGGNVPEPQCQVCQMG